MCEALFVMTWFCSFCIRSSSICSCNRKMIKSTNYPGYFWTSKKIWKCWILRDFFLISLSYNIETYLSNIEQHYFWAVSKDMKHVGRHLSSALFLMTVFNIVLGFLLLFRRGYSFVSRCLAKLLEWRKSLQKNGYNCIEASAYGVDAKKWLEMLAK